MAGGGIDLFQAQPPSGPVTLPSLANVPAEVLRYALTAREQDRAWVLIEQLASPATLDALDALSSSKLETLFNGWGKASGIQIGELIRLGLIIRDHSESLEADLINAGLRLRHCPSDDFNWRDLMIFIRFLPVTSALFSEMFPDQAGWTREALLMADQVDALRILAWQKTKDGLKGRNAPDPIPRPGVTPPQRAGSKTKAAPLSEVRARDARRHATTPAERKQELNDVFGSG
ncbi:hypothetical protein BN970_01373 [Mycolicibacterium conceptionense]|uniref:Tail assembly chaperone n=1 Tax=Mycolicibacterium conceptionense TaxID=451644 RepID=A0A0U1D3D6_9MYCO|nr:DUF5361 domain-containing protein [Mycolicibacterium conceptionense]ORV20967.1 hypothetical protein AWB98_01325 [Mycolicibacterium conceptionense]CQD07287.1 hypothetical protein BN970_01373 [Mycolicibacterium conceptionense]